MGARAKWTGRDAPPPERACAVTGCDSPAVAVLRADASAPRGWLVDLDGRTDGDPLCGRHADLATPAAGWVLHDERSNHRERHSIVEARRARPVAGPENVIGHLDLRRPEVPVSVDEMLDAQSPLLHRAFSKSREP
jgi:hypothetical protein